jgi:hypothetical protein
MSDTIILKSPIVNVNYVRVSRTLEGYVCFNVNNHFSPNGPVSVNLSDLRGALADLFPNEREHRHIPDGIARVTDLERRVTSLERNVADHERTLGRAGKIMSGEEGF